MTENKEFKPLKDWTIKLVQTPHGIEVMLDLQSFGESIGTAVMSKSVAKKLATDLLAFGVTSEESDTIKPQ